MRPPPHAGGSTAHEPAQKHPNNSPAKKHKKKQKKRKKKHKKSKKKLDFGSIVWYNNVTVSSIAYIGHQQQRAKPTKERKQT
jgi:hypothetical protein